MDLPEFKLMKFFEISDIVFVKEYLGGGIKNFFQTVQQHIKYLCFIVRNYLTPLRIRR